MKMRIVVLDGERENPGDLSWESFERLGELVVYDNTKPEEVADRIKGFDAVIVNKVKLDKSNLENADSVKYIGVLATGYNVIDIEYASKRGIVVTNVPAYGTEAVAQFSMALLLEICCHVGHHDKLVHDGVWSDSGKWSYWDRPLIELKDKTIGIIGMGRIGKTMSKLSKAMGMNVIYHDMIEYPGEEYGTFVTIEELYSRSDIISLHCPLTEDTYHLIDNEAIEKCKKGVVILNTSRGALIDAEALLAGIKSRKVGAACLDVYEEESEFFFEDFSGHILEDDTLARLISMPNVIVTSHQAFLTEEALSNIAQTTVNNIYDALVNGQCANELCYRCGNTEDCKDGKCF